MLKKLAAFITLITFIGSTVFEGGALADFYGSTATASGNVAGQMGNISESAGPVQSFQADLFTGRAQTSVPIFVPPGRKNVQPNLSLNYSSSGGNGWLGMGWGLDLGYISRNLKKGVPKYDSSDTYVFSFQGVYSELVLVGTNEYRAKDEALFLKFIHDPTNNNWIVTDKSGTKHYFGSTSDSKQTNASGTFKWALAKVKDTSGNYMSVTYTSDGGEIYPSQIDYNGNEDESFAHTHRVEFELEDRADDGFSYITGAKVTTAKRLKEIRVKVNNGSGTYELSRKYAIGYETSAATDRSRLKTVTEYGTDGTTALPVITFTYQDKPLELESLNPMGGIQRMSGSVDYDYIRNVNASQTDQSADGTVDLMDMNGDGLADRVQSDDENTTWKIQYNDGADNFEAMTDFGGSLHKPDGWGGYDYVSARKSAGQQVTDMVDMDGDGRIDRVIGHDQDTHVSGVYKWRVQLNNGGGFASYSEWTGVEKYNSTDQYYYPRYTSDAGETKTELMDMNGDGLPDRVQSKDNETNWKVQWNMGTGFGTMQNFGPIERWETTARYYHIRSITTGAETRVDLIDMNGDGLPDRIQHKDGQTVWKVQWNTGSGFTSMEDFGPIEKLTGSDTYLYIQNVSASGETKADLMDLNGDGLPDRVQAQDDNTVWKVQWNLGVASGTAGFSSMEDFTNILYMRDATKYDYPRRRGLSGRMQVDTADIDGDGLPDRLQADDDNTAWQVQKNKRPYPDLLSKISNGRGGTTEITYTPSTQFDNVDTSGKERLPFPIQAVTKVDQKDSFGNTYTTNYLYKGGMFDKTDREFRGFKEVTVTDAVGTKTINTFHQDADKKGRLEKKEVKDSSGNLFSKEETTWSVTNPYTGVSFVNVTQQDNYVYDGDGDYKQTRQTFTYDSYGNLASTVEQGDTSVSTDSRKTANTYVYNTTDYIVNTLSKTTLYDCASSADCTSGTTVKAERYFYYDGATSITTAPTKGLLTKEEEWLSTASGCGTPGVCTNNPKTTMTYDDYGNVLTVTDARSYTTTNTYETTYHLFLTEIENTLTHTREFTYNARIAQILTSTDQNSQVTETQYDVLGRVTKVISPEDSSSEPTQEFSYDFPASNCTSNCVTKTTTKVKSSVPGQTFTQLITYSFTDGLGREIQRRSPSEGSDQIVSGIVEFDNRGLVSKQYVPYFATSSTSYVAPDTSKPKAQFTYDAVGRRTRIDYADGTNSQVAFDDFLKTTTDQRGKQLKYTNDAYGRLVKVEELNSGSTYTTTYEYDVLNNLTKTTDHASNQTTITYDSLSRKTGMTDSDMGTWSYTYDLNDNLASQTDAKSQTISFTYDALNRVTLKDLPSGETDPTYSYDSAPSGFSGQTGYWVGRLAKVSDASGDHEFKYDKLGRVLSDKKTVDSNGYQFDRTYDSMGRVRTLTYPDTEVVTYTYNGFGDMETISGLKSSVTTDYIKEVNYNASGQITFTKYGNNVTSDYTYNSNTLRLSNILTKKPDGTTKLQDLSYTFDNNGNVSTIADTVNSMSQSFTYDDLNRLTQGIGSAYGTQNYAYDAIGNMTTKGSVTMSYGAGAPGPHAVTSVTGTNLPTFCNNTTPCEMDYDANGNMTERGSDTLAYDSENRLKEMTVIQGEPGTTNYTLKSGWNVISFTHLPDNKNVSNVLSSLTFGTDYDQVSYWDEATDTWKHWVNDTDFNDFTQFEHGKTYEIYNNSGSDKSFSVTGKTSAVDISHSILAGDNFISPAVKTATNISTVLSSLTLDTHYSDVKRFNAAAQTWQSYDNGDFTQFEPGKGYIIVGLTNSSFSYGETEITTTFVYDSTGARVKKTAAGTTTIYLGKDYDITGGTSTKYVFLGDRRIANKDNSGTLLFYHEDHINSSNVVTDSSGNQAALYEYTPYGETATYTGSASVKHQFTGHEKDDSSGLLYMNARYMDPQLGRFITADPTIQHSTDPQDFNRYAYARNNPIQFTDPTGLGWLSKLFAVVGAVIGVIATWGMATPIIIGAAMAGGALYGLAGAAIEKSSLMRGALQGAAIGAAVGGTAVALGAGGGAAGAGGSGGGSGTGAGAGTTANSGLSGAGQAAIEVAPTLVEISGEMAGSAIIPNLVGVTILAGAGAGAGQMNEVFWKPSNYQRYQNEMETLRLEGNGIQKIGLPDDPVFFALSLMTTGAVSAFKKASVELTQEGLEHIVLRHWPTSGAKGAGKFAPGITARNLKVMISEAVDKATRVYNSWSSRTVYEYEFKEAIGTNIQGKAANILRVVVEKTRKVKTAFPI